MSHPLKRRSYTHEMFNSRWEARLVSPGVAALPEVVVAQIRAIACSATSNRELMARAQGQSELKPYPFYPEL